MPCLQWTGPPLVHIAFFPGVLTAPAETPSGLVLLPVTARGRIGRIAARDRLRLRRLEVDLGIDVGGVQADVPEPDADRIDVHPGAQQVCGRRVSLIPSSELAAHRLSTAHCFQ